jgi:hypothetical protein
MPRLDGTGPDGKGPKTGRKMEDCKSIEEKLETKRKGLGPCGDGNPRGGGKGCAGRRRGAGGITYFS